MTTTASQKPKLISALQNFCDEIVSQKTAAAKAAGVKSAGPTPADPGGYLGKSTHPTATADNGAQAATEGARSSENEADVKEQQGPPSVNSTADAKPGDDKDNSLNIGTKATLTGENPAVEDDYKGDKDDPGTSAPATVEDGEKYGSFKRAARNAVAMGNSILADLAVGAPVETKPTTPAAKTAGAAAPAAPAAGTSSTPSTAMLAGYELASQLGLDKVAAEASVSGVIADGIREGYALAEMVHGFMKKRASDEEESGEDHTSGSGKPEEASSGANTSSGAGGGGESSSGSGGGGSAPPAGGGSSNPLAAVMGGGDMGAGGMGGEPPTLAQQPASEEEAIQALIAALAELGVPVEALQGAPAPGGGAPPMPAGGGMGGGMGAPGGGAGMAAPPPSPMPDGAKLAAAITKYQRSGRYQVKHAHSRRDREIINAMKSHVREMLQF